MAERGRKAANLERNGGTGMNIYQEKMLLRTRDCDFNGKWRFSAILEAMQEVAGDQCEGEGLGRVDLAKKGVAWVLVRMEVRMNRFPGIGEQVVMTTVPKAPRHKLFPRYYIMTDEKGETVGMASSLWMLMDLESREAVSEADYPIEFIIPEGWKPPMGMPAPLFAEDGEKRTLVYSPVYTELDFNQHVNNTKYADWVCNMLGPEIMREKEIARMILDYNAEVKPGQQVTFEMIQNENRCRLNGICEGHLAFGIGCELRIRS